MISFVGTIHSGRSFPTSASESVLGSAGVFVTRASLPCCLQWLLSTLRYCREDSLFTLRHLRFFVGDFCEPSSRVPKARECWEATCWSVWPRRCTTLMVIKKGQNPELPQQEFQNKKVLVVRKLVSLRRSKDPVHFKKLPRFRNSCCKSRSLLPPVFRLQKGLGRAITQSHLCL